MTCKLSNNGLKITCNKDVVVIRCKAPIQGGMSSMALLWANIMNEEMSNMERKRCKCGQGWIGLDGCSFCGYGS